MRRTSEKIVRLSLVLSLALLLAACGMTQNVPSICDEAPPDSVLCSLTSHTGLTIEQIDVLFQLINYELIFRAGIKPLYMEVFFNELELLIETDTYSNLAAKVLLSVESIRNFVGMEVILLTQLVPQLNAYQMPISEFDRHLLNVHIEKQRRILDSFEREEQ